MYDEETARVHLMCASRLDKRPSDIDRDGCPKSLMLDVGVSQQSPKSTAVEGDLQELGTARDASIFGLVRP